MQAGQAICSAGRQLTLVAVNHYCKLFYPLMQGGSVDLNAFDRLEYLFQTTMIVERKDTHLYSQRSPQALRRPFARAEMWR
jgi:hypothetical protein